ncbi:metal-dependent hydrolase [Deinococcus irradiatisoli]|uniref:Metal-dependent hydrolase n=1 Tax=Deinococcus irradiatisoli TaxID=2202254 RepID=A0A2Z3JGI1_9DEIO|nr:SprT family zinc-dependent metalloprotease [Deinococcus irradiatisoli]AWN24267.1 metal-dependent hydrolase [Deinococcus irradiatisoli]
MTAGEKHIITVSGIEVEVVRKAIKNLHLAVYPPEGHVRVAAPLRVDDDAVRLFTVPRLPWIRRQQAKFQGQARQSARDYVSGESHYLWGHRYRLRVIEAEEVPQVKVANKSTLLLTVPPNSDRSRREAVMLAHYRAELKARLPGLVTAWSRYLGVTEPNWAVRQMKTKWGSCSPSAQRISLNLELAKKAPHCLEYVVVHELAHLHERHHNDRFRALLDQHLPLWRSYRDELNQSPLRSETW